MLFTDDADYRWQLTNDLSLSLRTEETSTPSLSYSEWLLTRLAEANLRA